MTRERSAHRCPCCGRRTYRRRRRLPVLGRVDDRCQPCTVRGFDPATTHPAGEGR